MTVTVTDDSDDEPLEGVGVSITAHSSYAIGDSGSALVGITDDDLPEVTVAKIVDVAETGGYGVFRFSRTLGELGTELTVWYTVGGTATNGTDYASVTGTVTFAANVATVDVVITPNTDSSTEGTETVTVTISSDPTYTIGTANSDTLDIREEAAGAVSGKFWSDTNGDGTLNTGETGLAYRSVFLMKAAEVVAQTITDASGNYSFSGVTAGTYSILFEVPGEFTPTTSVDGIVTAAVVAGATTSNINAGAQPPAGTWAINGKEYGIDWSTFDEAHPTEATRDDGVRGQYYKVKTVSNKVIDVWITHPWQSQNPIIRARYPKLFFEPNLQYNCHAYTFGLTHVRISNGSMIHCSVNTQAAAKTLIDELYTEVTDIAARKALAAGKRVVGTFSTPAGLYAHSVVLTKIVLNQDGSVNFQESECNTKNGDQAIKLNESLNKVKNVYAGDHLAVADRATTFKFRVLK